MRQWKKKLSKLLKPWGTQETAYMHDQMAVSFSKEGVCLQVPVFCLDYYFDIPYCYLFSLELNFAKIEQTYFAGLEFHDLAKKICLN